MILAVTGSRDFGMNGRACNVIRHLCEAWGVTEIVHGGACGIDNAAAAAAHCLKLTNTVMRPDYAAFKGREKAAPLARNTEIVTAADSVVGFWDGKSRGTLDTLRKAKAAGKLAAVYNSLCERWDDWEATS